MPGGDEMLKNVRMRIPAMSTPEVIRQVSDALVAIQGVGDIGVSGEEGLVEVAFDPEKTSSGEIQSALGAVGFPPD